MVVEIFALPNHYTSSVVGYYKRHLAKSTFDHKEEIRFKEYLFVIAKYTKLL